MAKETKFVLVNGTVKEVKVSTKRARLIGRLPKDLTYRITRVYCTSLATNALNGKSNDISSEAVMACENCGKHILNVAVVQASDGKNFNVGMDCALTLEGMDIGEYERHENFIKEAKAIRARIRNAFKSKSHLEVKLEIYDGNMKEASKKYGRTFWYDYGFIVAVKYSDTYTAIANFGSYGNKEFFNDLVIPSIIDLVEGI